MTAKVTDSILDREIPNYVHYSLCFLAAHFVHHKLAKCNCAKCPFHKCKYRLAPGYKRERCAKRK